MKRNVAVARNYVRRCGQEGRGEQNSAWNREDAVLPDWRIWSGRIGDGWGMERRIDRSVGWDWLMMIGAKMGGRGGE